jgi:hypothetical protein
MGGVEPYLPFSPFTSKIYVLLRACLELHWKIEFLEIKMFMLKLFTKVCFGYSYSKKLKYF